MLSVLILWCVAARPAHNNRSPEAAEYRSSRTRYSFHSDNYAPSRYYTNCLAYIYSKFMFLLCMDYTFILYFIKGDQRLNYLNRI